MLDESVIESNTDRTIMYVPSETELLENVIIYTGGSSELKARQERSTMNFDSTLLRRSLWDINAQKRLRSANKGSDSKVGNTGNVKIGIDGGTRWFNWTFSSSARRTRKEQYRRAMIQLISRFDRGAGDEDGGEWEKGKNTEVSNIVIRFGWAQTLFAYG